MSLISDVISVAKKVNMINESATLGMILTARSKRNVRSVQFICHFCRGERWVVMLALLILCHFRR